LRTRKTGLGTRRTGSGSEKDGIGNKVRGKPVIKIAQIITVPGCSTGSGMILIKLPETRILIKGDSWFYTQPNVGRWMAPSECANMAPSKCTSIAPSECMLTVT
jgi:hypothetical protein